MILVRYALAILGFSFAASAIPAGAQGNFIVQGHFLTQLDTSQPRTVLLAYSECLVRRKAEEANELLAWEAYSERAAELIGDMVNSGGDSACLSYSRQPAGWMEMSERAFRGALSEVLYVQSFPEAISPELVSRPDADVSQTEFVSRVEGAASPIEELLTLFAECVVGAAPEGVDALIRTDIGGEAERQAIEMLLLNFGNCLWEGQRAEFSAENLRAVLATAAYRRATGIEQRRGPRSEEYADWFEENAETSE